MNLGWIDIIGYVAVAFNLYAYWSNTMIKLRVAAIVSNILFIVFAAYHHVLPNLILNCVLLPLNISRIIAIRKQIDYVKLAAEIKFNADWLKPYMKKYICEPNKAIFNKGDRADKAFYIMSGSIYIPELNISLKEGDLFGEMGLLTNENKRTMTASTELDTKLLYIEYTDLLQLYFQNPQFGFYLLKLLTQRLMDNKEIVR